MGGRMLKSPFVQLLALAGGGAFMLLCAAFPGFAGIWLRLFIRPFGGLLAWLSAQLPFPAIEIAAAVLAAFLSLGFLRSLLRSIYTRRARALGRFGRRVLTVFAVLFCMYAGLWAPSYRGAPVEAQPASVGQVEALCRLLIDRLNGTDLRFSDLEASLRIARAAVSDYADTLLPENAVKIARYPEWMDALDASGLYSPWTGEAIVHPGLAPAARIFTAVHELMHAQGIADEGHANVLAWSVCRNAGGEAAASADLYALRYAMARLRGHSEERWRACTLRMDGALVEAFGSVRGFDLPAENAAVSGNPLRNYGALTDWLAGALSV